MLTSLAVPAVMGVSSLVYGNSSARWQNSPILLHFKTMENTRNGGPI